MVEVMKIMSPPAESPLHALPPSVPPALQPLLTHTSARDPWTLPGKSGAVSQGSLLLSPGSWCTQGSACALQESVSQSCVSSDGSLLGLMMTSYKTAYAIPRSTAPRAPAPAQSTAGLDLHRRCSDTVLSQSLGPGVYKVCLSPPSVSGEYGV